ncbi:MAG: 4-alpha-glucanotransferase [Bacteroidales bacterium]|nr:4-alpha-glucanotransferase [Bacteroidales bacterium]
MFVFVITPIEYMIDSKNHIPNSRIINKRIGGVLLHPTSLSGPYGTGTLGQKAYIFIDKLKLAGQKIWQILPLCPTAKDYSPYTGNTAFGGNILLIDPEKLVEEQLLHTNEVTPISNSGQTLDYDSIYNHRISLLKKAYHRFINSPKYISSDFHHFCDENEYWLQDYAVYLSLKNRHDGKPWYEWPTEYSKMNIDAVKAFEQKEKDEIRFHKFCQYHFYKQWHSLKDYANTQGVQIIGDLPIYIGMDSVECWLRPELFKFDIYRRPKQISGVPPDAFNGMGQIWGHPLYDWNFMHSTHFSWLIRRIIFSLEMYDYLRLDHFRAYTEYYAIPANEKDAIRGEWLKAPGEQFLFALKEQLINLPIIIDDLGESNKTTEQLKKKFKLIGMRTLQFGLNMDDNSKNLPHYYNKDLIAYTGTHDNNTCEGWYKDLDKEQKAHIKRYLNNQSEPICDSMIQAVWASVANIAIAPMQDILGLGSEARMNKPGTSENNWLWRMQENQFNEEHIKKMKTFTELYQR